MGGRLYNRIEGAARPRLKAVVFVVITLVLLGMIAHGNYAGSGDAVHYMVIAHSLVFDADLDLSNDYSDPSNIVQVPPGLHAETGMDGALRPVHGVGLPLLAAPPFAIAYLLAEQSDRLPESLREALKVDSFIALRQLLGLFMILVTATLAVLFFDEIATVSAGAAAACLWTLVWALSPPILTHGYVFLTEIPTALIALIVFSRARAFGVGPDMRAALLNGALCGLLLLVHVRNIGLVLALVIVAIRRTPRPRPRATFGFFTVGLALSILAKIALNLRFWGTLIETPHERPGPWPGVTPFLEEVFVRTFGVLFDARHGVLFSAPVLLLAPAAWLLLLRGSRDLAIDIALPVLCYLGFILTPMTNVHGWRGGWSEAARFLVPVAPFLGLPFPVLLAERRLRPAVATIVSLQLLLDAYFWGHPMLLWSEGPGPAAFLQNLVGDSVAEMVPVWSQFDPALITIGLLAAFVWSAFTWMLLRRLDKP